MDQASPAVMTVREVAEYVRIPLSSVYKLAQEGRIPCQKAGRQWRFNRQAIDLWLSGMPTAPHDKPLQGQPTDEEREP